MLGRFLVRVRGFKDVSHAVFLVSSFSRRILSNDTAGWWSWADALVTQRGVEGESSAPFKYAWPGIIATIAMVLINMLSKDSLQDIADSGDEETNTRARLWLLCSFLLCFGSIAASIAVLISCTEQGQYVAVGVGSVLQCGFILASALILWVFRTRS